jgi:hypothetical protein
VRACRDCPVLIASLDLIPILRLNSTSQTPHVPMRLLLVPVSSHRLASCYGLKHLLPPTPKLISTANQHIAACSAMLEEAMPQSAEGTPLSVLSETATVLPCTLSSTAWLQQAPRGEHMLPGA